jgi:hypothetical protein
MCVLDFCSYPIKNLNVNGEGSIDFNIRGDKNVIQVSLTIGECNFF